jgi:PhnB protein
MAFHPYLFFGGNCGDAFARYQEIFGGEPFVMTMADAPPGEHPVPPGKEHLVMHAALKLNDGGLLMGSDDMMSDSVGPVQGMMVSWSTPDAGEAKRVFEALAEGGHVSQPLIETFFAPAFGMCTDRFGTPWMVTAEGENQPG